MSLEVGTGVSSSQIDAAEAYESLFVPALFGAWATVVADAARVASRDRVLDVACGTGVLAREAARRAGPRSVVGLDAAPGMLAVAARRAPDIAWRLGTAEELPFEDRSFDVVMSQFGLMFFSDRERALREMRRVLRPGGRLAIAVWDALDRIPAYAAEVALFDDLLGRPAGDALRAPFVLGDRAALAALLESAGASAVEVSTIRGTARFPSIRVMVEADLRGWLPAVGIELDEARIQRVLHQADRALASHVVLGDDGVAFECPAHVVTAR